MSGVWGWGHGGLRALLVKFRRKRLPGEALFQQKRGARNETLRILEWTRFATECRLGPVTYHFPFVRSLNTDHSLFDSFKSLTFSEALRTGHYAGLVSPHDPSDHHRGRSFRSAVRPCGCGEPNSASRQHKAVVFLSTS